MTMGFPEVYSAHVVEMLPFIGIGFVAQLIDGALGMAFGVLTNTLLVSFMGLVPARASASVHLVETFTTAASGLSHIIQRNVDWRLFARLTVPGLVGGMTGAYLLSTIDGSIAKPFVLAYLSAIGLYLLWRAWQLDHPRHHRAPRIVEPLGLAGGFLDAVGGGGWGPVVTSNLLVQGTEPRTTIGTVNASEFVLTLSVSLTFIFALGFSAFTVAAVGLIIGGLLAAPLGAIVATRVSAKRLITMVGLLLTATSLFSLYNALA